MEEEFSFYIIVFLGVVEYSTPLPVHECTEMSTSTLCPELFLKTFLVEYVEWVKSKNGIPVRWATGVSDLAWMNQSYGIKIVQYVCTYVRMYGMYYDSFDASF